MLTRILQLVILSTFLLGCIDNSSISHSEDIKNEFISEKNLVAVTNVTKKVFWKSIKCDGYLRAHKKATLNFSTHGIIDFINYKTGDHLKKGSVIAGLQTQMLDIEERKTKHLLQQAKLKQNEILVNMGYDSPNIEIPDSIIQMTELRTNKLEYELTLQEIKLKKTKNLLTAPFSGRVYDLNIYPQTNSSEYEKVCSIIQDDILHVEFHILEEEYEMISPRDKLFISRIGDNIDQVEAIVHYIDPQVDENGFILVRGSFKNRNKRFLDGMNVNVQIRKQLGKHIVIPRNALQIRDNKSIVFTYEDGLAKWKYVRTGFESDTEICIIEGLNEGENLIVSGQDYLSHNTEVTIDSTNSDKEFLGKETLSLVETNTIKSSPKAISNSKPSRTTSNSKYLVQIGVFSKEKDMDYEEAIKAYGRLIIERVGSLHKYSVGYFATKEDALAIKKSLSEGGYGEGFVKTKVKTSQH